MKHHRSTSFGGDRLREWQPITRVTHGIDEATGEAYEEHHLLDPAHHLDGRPVDRFIPEITVLKRAGDLGAAAALLERICARLMHAGRDLPPYYFEQLAIVYRRQQRYADEVQLLERYLAADPRPTTRGATFSQRLAKARALVLRR